MMKSLPSIMNEVTIAAARANVAAAKALKMINEMLGPQNNG